MLRVGQGFDAHRFEEDEQRPLVLGGVRIPHAAGLHGHSDADVVAHALSDAILGASSMGDLGRHFPDTDDRWAGADSMELLRRVVEMAGRKGWHAVNADCTVIAQAPRLAPYLEEMGATLAGALDAPVSVKATAPEGLGALGRHEGIAALAVVLLESVEAQRTG